MNEKLFKTMDAIEENIGIVRRRHINDHKFEYWINRIVRSPEESEHAKNPKIEIEIGIIGVQRGMEPNSVQRFIMVGMAELEDYGIYALWHRAADAMKEMAK